MNGLFTGVLITETSQLLIEQVMVVRNGAATPVRERGGGGGDGDGERVNHCEARKAWSRSAARKSVECSDLLRGREIYAPARFPTWNARKSVFAPPKDDQMSTVYV
ncbi:hypothetical protein GWI33_018631 [Rhynchophorus ferrugineus]|uniref:Uncharacterized protein n=1 Tax=Rhynchophorus ferrugineus TaxID=354439 RepID=A0A834M7S9_RHYFE|nr:hypothetical protein GWI33_018631 [Rhynchophorus ferrugineus]